MDWARTNKTGFNRKSQSKDEYYSILHRVFDFELSSYHEKFQLLSSIWFQKNNALNMLLKLKFKEF